MYLHCHNESFFFNSLPCICKWLEGFMDQYTDAHRDPYISCHLTGICAFLWKYHLIFVHLVSQQSYMCILHTILHFIPIVLWAGSHLIPVCTPVFTCPSLLLPFLFISYPNFGEWYFSELPFLRFAGQQAPPTLRPFLVHSLRTRPVEGADGTCSFPFRERRSHCLLLQKPEQHQCSPGKLPRFGVPHHSTAPLFLGTNFLVRLASSFHPGCSALSSAATTSVRLPTAWDEWLPEDSCSVAETCLLQNTAFGGCWCSTELSKLSWAEGGGWAREARARGLGRMERNRGAGLPSGGHW